MRKSSTGFTELVGLYSAEAAMKYGTVFYATPTGMEIEVTGVFASPGAELPAGGYEKYRFKDAEIVGPVVRFLRSGQNGSSTFHLQGNR